MKKEPAWLSKAAVLAIHERLLAEHGGATGARDEGSLDAALASPKNRFAYEKVDIIRLAANYTHALTRNHPFSDGNKRVALTTAGVFLELNGFRLVASEQNAVAAIVAFSDRTFDEDAFAAWLKGASTKLARSRATRSPRTRASARRPRPPRS